MESCYVIVADSARARFFVLDEAAEGAGGPDLVELEDLVNPEAESAGKDLYSENKSGRNTAPMGAGAHGYDDHRDRHVAELERRFASLVAGRGVQGATGRQSGRLVMVAEKRMLGHLREALAALPAHSWQVSELAKNLTKLSAHDLHEHLAENDLLPERRVPAGSSWSG